MERSFHFHVSLFYVDTFFFLFVLFSLGFFVMTSVYSEAHVAVMLLPLRCWHLGASVPPGSLPQLPRLRFTWELNTNDRTLNVRRTLILIVMDTEQSLSTGLMTAHQQSSSSFLDLYFCLCVGTGTSFVRYHLRSRL